MATRHGTFKLANELYQRKGDIDTSQKKSSVQTTLISKNNHAATSALFGTEHEGSHSNYMNAKVAKLRQVQDKHVEFLNQNNTLAKIFKGLFFYINGRQHLQLVALKQLILQRGGMVETYHTDIVTHMVCQELSESKAQKLREQYLKKNFPVQVIRSEWITDSIDAGKCLPIEMYKPTCVDETGTDQQKITSFVKKSIINNNNNKKHDVNNNCNNNNSSSNSKKSNNNNRNNSGKKNNGDVCILPTTMPNISSTATTTTTTTTTSEILKTNVNKNKKMQKTSESDLNFVNNFFANSRLHHIGRYRAHLKPLILQLQKSKILSLSGQGFHNSSGLEKDHRRIIAHVDMDCYFASVALLKRPELRTKPVCVAHGNGNTSEISSANYVAREFGLRAGMFMRKAKELCHELIILPYEFDEYARISELVYCTLYKYADKVEVVSCDEAYIDITNSVFTVSYGGSNDSNGSNNISVNIQRRVTAYLQDIQKSISETTGCTASFGVGRNKLVAKLATSYAKKKDGPNSHCALIHNDIEIENKNVEDFISTLSITTMPSIGWKRRQVMEEKGIEKCGDIKNWSEKDLAKLFNGDQIGKNLYEGIRGIGSNQLESFFQMQKSVSAVINYAVRFITERRFLEVMKDLSDNVTLRLKQCGENGGMTESVTVKLKIAIQGWKEPGKFLGHGHCRDVTKSQKVQTPICTKEDIFKVVNNICHGILNTYCYTKVKRAKDNGFTISDIRGIGIQLNHLISYDSQENAKTTTLSQMWQGNANNNNNNNNNGDDDDVIDITDNIITKLNNDLHNSNNEIIAMKIYKSPARPLKRKKEKKTTPIRNFMIMHNNNNNNNNNNNTTTSENGGGSRKRRKKCPKKKQVNIRSFIPNKRLLEKIQQIQGHSQAIDEETFNQLPMNIRSELTRAAQRDNHKNKSNGNSVNRIGRATNNNNNNNNNNIVHANKRSRKNYPTINTNNNVLNTNTRTRTSTTTTTANESNHTRSSNINIGNQNLMLSLPVEETKITNGEEINLLNSLGYNDLASIVNTKKWNLNCRMKIKEFLSHFKNQVNSQGTEGICLCSLVFICQRKLKVLQSMVNYFLSLCKNEVYMDTWGRKSLFIISCIQDMMEKKCGGRLNLENDHIFLKSTNRISY